MFSKTEAPPIEFSAVLQPSVRLFWPDASLVAVVDREKPNLFLPPLLNSSANVVSSVHRAWRGAGMVGHTRQKLHILYPEEAVQPGVDFVGYVDVDTLFTTVVTPHDVFAARSAPAPAPDPRSGRPAPLPCSSRVSS